MVEKKRNGYKTTLHAIAVSNTRKFIQKARSVISGYSFNMCPPGGAKAPRNNAIHLKQYPPDSPDFNPCEYIICQIKNDAYYNYKRSKDYTINNLIKCVQDAWDNLPERRLLPVFIKSYKNMINCIKNNGDYK